MQACTVFLKLVYYAAVKTGPISLLCAPQFDTYRQMRDLALAGDSDQGWAGYCPATNCLWLSYLVSRGVRVLMCPYNAYDNSEECLGSEEADETKRRAHSKHMLSLKNVCMHAG